MSRLTSIVAVALVSTGVAWGQPILWSGNGHSYELVADAGLKWEVARDNAESLEWQGAQGHLVTITSAAEDDFIHNNVLPITSQTTAWLGGFQDPGISEPPNDAGWMWVIGEPWGYTNWDSGEPNQSGEEDYLEMFGLTGTWNDIDNTPDGQNVGYIVEYDTAIPTVSEWGLTVMGLLLLTSGTLVMWHRRRLIAA